MRVDVLGMRAGQPALAILIELFCNCHNLLTHIIPHSLSPTQHTHTPNTHTHTHSCIQGEEALLKMMRTAYAHFNWGYFERDRLLFSLTLALEVSVDVASSLRSITYYLITQVS